MGLVAGRARTARGTARGAWVIDPRTPVLVGAAAVQQQGVAPGTAREALALMIQAVEGAAANAGAPDLARRAQLYLVPEGTWAYRDPGRAVAAHFGAQARTVWAAIGVLQQTLLSRAATAIATGEADVVVICGGEAMDRVKQARLTGVTPEETSLTEEPDESLRPADDVLEMTEIQRSLAVPAHQYAVMETALRAAADQSVAEHRRDLNELWARFSAVAATNPDAWDRAERKAQDLEAGAPGNGWLAAPYTRRHCSQWNVDQAAAVVLCSTEVATAFGVAADRWVFPVAAAESNAMIPLSARAGLGRSPAIACNGTALRARTGIDFDDVAHLDLYSCFPSAVRLQLLELGIDPSRELTLTGGMSFAGGPLNNYVLQAMVRLVDRLRNDPDSLALSTSVSGMVTKHGMSLWSGRPPARFFVADDTTEATLAATPVRPRDPPATGPGRIDGYTALWSKAGPQQAVVIATTADGRRTVATAADPALAAAMTEDEWVGREVVLDGATFQA